MPRLARKSLNTEFLHVMVQGVNKEYIFHKEEYIKKYLEIISNNIDERNFTIIAYCMMNNHAHFLIHTEDIMNFGRCMQKINLQYAKMYNKLENRCGVLFRNRYQTEPICDYKYLVNCIKYIHNNPVKAGMVDKCEDYEYSSYRDYKNNNGLTKSKIMNDIFGENYDYTTLFEQTYEKRFIDIDEDYDDVQNYIHEGIREFCKEKNTNVTNIFLSRDILKDLIKFLKENCKITYVEIMSYFEITRGTMDWMKNN